MSGKILLDTNAVLYLLSGNPCMEKYVDSEFIFSVITELECLSYSKLSRKEEMIIKEFFRAGEVKNISDRIKFETIEIRRIYGLKLPDSIIAATAIVNKIPLVSADKVFNRIENLHFINVSV